MQEGEGEHLHRGGAEGGGGEQLQRGGGYEVHHREEDGEESEACEQLQEDPDKDVCKEEMQKGGKSQIVLTHLKITGAPQMLRDSEDVSRGETEGTMQFETKTDMSRRWLQVILAIT